MDEKFDNDEIFNRQIGKYSHEAELLLQNEDKVERFLERLERKLSKIPVLGEKLVNVPILISLVRSYVRKEYQDIPLGSVIAIVAALLYFLAPVDLIPDSIPIIGYLDDVAMVAFMWRMVADDVEEYKKWQRDNGRRFFNE
ncbi:MAG: DUF1232 domain-containing protein [Firmicutes bacterium]|jgi:uncharacterized membrane protein YkvA (DUF1232 family)|nr:DUF1232 domain-containing protein [Bacillota bacterium]